MRIVQIGTDVLPIPPRYGGAYETYIYGISKALATMGYEVHIIALDGEEREYLKEGIIYHTFKLDSIISKIFSMSLGIIDNPNKNVFLLTNIIIKKLNNITESFGEIDIIHVHLPVTMLGPLFFKLIKGSNTSLLIHWHNEPRYGYLRRFLLHKPTFLMYDHHCPVSNYVKKQLLFYINELYNKTTVVPNAVDTDFFRYNEKNRNKMRQKLNIKDEEYVILYIGRIIPEKGLHHLILTMPSLIKRFKKIKLLLLGPKGHYEKEEPYYFQYIWYLIKKLNIEKNITYLARVERKYLPSIYSTADVIVVPSLWQDPCPTVVLEAMSCGKPVVAYNVGGIPEIIKNDKTGYIVKKGDISSLKRSIEIVLMKKTKWSVESIRTFIEKKYSYKAVSKKLIKVYREIHK